MAFFISSFFFRHSLQRSYKRRLRSGPRQALNRLSSIVASTTPPFSSVPDKCLLKFTALEGRIRRRCTVHHESSDPDRRCAKNAGGWTKKRTLCACLLPHYNPQVALLLTTNIAMHYKCIDISGFLIKSEDGKVASRGFCCFCWKWVLKRRILRSRQKTETNNRKSTTLRWPSSRCWLLECALLITM